MRTMKKWIFCLLVVFLAACSNEIPEQQPAKRSGRTVLAYLISNNQAGSLDTYLLGCPVRCTNFSSLS